MKIIREQKLTRRRPRRRRGRRPRGRAAASACADLRSVTLAPPPPGPSAGSPTSARRTLAVPPLRALVDAGFEVALVVSQPDRRRGRGSALVPSPVKAAALELGLPVTDRVDDVVDGGVPLGVVVAFGRLIKPHVLEAVPMVNLHFSLLPRWRGAAPVERAILAGDERTGVDLMVVEEGARHRRHLRAGPRCRSVPTTRSRSCATGWSTGQRACWSTRCGTGSGSRRRRTASRPTPTSSTAEERHLDWHAPAVDVAPPRAGRRGLDHPRRPAAQVWRTPRAARRRRVPWCRPATARSSWSRCSPRARPAWRAAAGPTAPAGSPATRSARDRHRPRGWPSTPSTASSATAPTPTSSCPSCSAQRPEPRDRHFATELVYGTTRMRRACDFLVDRFLTRDLDPRVRNALRLGAYQLHFLAMPPARRRRRDGRGRAQAGARARQRRAAPGGRRAPSPGPTTPPASATRTGSSTG